MSHQKPLLFTKEGFRYNWIEDDEPLCKIYIEQLNEAAKNKPNIRIQPPNFTKRKIISNVVKLSENDRAPQLRLDEKCLEVTGEKGYSMVRATHGCNRGKFYFEVHVDSMPENTATRIGWSQYYSNLQAPLGYDHYGYSWRSRFGTRFHQARGKSFDNSGGYREGDTLGCMIELPFGNDKDQTQCYHLPISAKATGLLVRTKKGIPTMMEEQDKPPSLSSMKTLVGSKISFYKNGRLVGVAYEDILDGFYYPTISLYKSCKVAVNFGPNFQFPPEKFNETSKNHIRYEPASNMAEKSILDNLLTDILYIVDRENVWFKDGKRFDPPVNELQREVEKCIEG